MIENSSQLLSDHRVVYRDLRSRLRACGFEVHATVLNTKFSGIPQTPKGLTLWP